MSAIKPALPPPKKERPAANRAAFENNTGSNKHIHKPTRAQVLAALRYARIMWAPPDEAGE